MTDRRISETRASSRGRWVNSGNGPTIQPIDIGHDTYMGLLEPESAFWSLVRKDKLSDALTDNELLARYRRSAVEFSAEMETLRFGLAPSAVYFNPTARCNLNCRYCYIPESMRRSGPHMGTTRLLEAMEKLRRYFDTVITDGRKPQVVFHGAEPLMNKEAVFEAISAFSGAFQFGIQTNAVCLEDDDIAFLVQHNVAVGLSLDGASSDIADRTRVTWAGEGVFATVIRAVERLGDYPNVNVICTVTDQNLTTLCTFVEFLHEKGVGQCMLNPVRCTLEGGRSVKPRDAAAAEHYLAALERTHALYTRTGRKLIVANFANILLGIIAPAARRLMCDISPCGAGRCFFAVGPEGDMYPCSEFVGLPDYLGGNLFTSDIDSVLVSEPFQKVSNRRVEEITPCRECAIRHFCGAPCPAEAVTQNGNINTPGAFCELYEAQVRYALRLIADGKADDFLWNGWDAGAEETFRMSTL